MQTVEIRTEFIKLDSFLKYAAVFETGGQAKEEIAAGNVLVNDQTETRRGRKLYDNDTVTVVLEDGKSVVFCVKSV